MVILKEAKRKLGREAHRHCQVRRVLAGGRLGPGRMPRLPVMGPGIYPGSAAVGLCDLSPSPSCLGMSICAMKLLNRLAASFCASDIKPGKWAEKPP